MYAYQPRSIWALGKLLEREALGQTARLERFAARLLYIIAAGRHIDTDQTEDFRPQTEAAFENPFEKKRQRRQPETAEEIKQYVLCLLEGKEWI